MPARLPFLPGSPPRATRQRVEALLNRLDVTDGVRLVGVRGYYHDDHSDNERGIYDDAIFVLSPQVFAGFNANTDPSASRRGMATLERGVWKYKVGIHGLSRPERLRYTALVQAAPVTVRRDGTGLDTGWFGINIHRGGRASTSSLGCQTIVPEQWESFIALVRGEMKRCGQTTINYHLV